MRKTVTFECKTCKTGAFSYFWNNFTNIFQIFYGLIAISAHNSAQNLKKLISGHAKKFIFRRSELGLSISYHLEINCQANRPYTSPDQFWLCAAVVSQSESKWLRPLNYILLYQSGIIICPFFRNVQTQVNKH